MYICTYLSTQTYVYIYIHIGYRCIEMYRYIVYISRSATAMLHTYTCTHTYVCIYTYNVYIYRDVQIYCIYI